MSAEDEVGRELRFAYAISLAVLSVDRIWYLFPIPQVTLVSTWEKGQGPTIWVVVSMSDGDGSPPQTDDEA